MKLCAFVKIRRGTAYCIQAPLLAAGSTQISSPEKVRERVMKRFSVPFSRENMPPRPGTTSMISWVWLQAANCGALI